MVRLTNVRLWGHYSHSKGHGCVELDGAKTSAAKGDATDELEGKTSRTTVARLVTRCKSIRSNTQCERGTLFSLANSHAGRGAGSRRGALAPWGQRCQLRSNNGLDS
jgi:hypothetical protein